MNIESFPMRAKTAFWRMNLKTERDIRRAIKSKMLHPKHLCCFGYGLDTHRIVCALLKLAYPKELPNYFKHPSCEACQKRPY